jgi:glycosidase
VRFRFAGLPGTRSVALAGTFNSWAGDAAFFSRDGDGGWQITLPIAPGRHHYKFVVDGEDWIRDPANPWVSEDAQNNSCLTITDSRELFIRHGQVTAQAPSSLYRRRQAVASPAWLADAVVYQLSARAMGGGIDALCGRLDYLQELGINTVWLMPVHPIGIERRGGQLGDPYAVRDFLAVDPELGDMAALRRLVTQVHARRMRILYDGTLNRAACDHPLTRTHPDGFTRDRAGRPMYAVPGRSQFCGFDFSSPDLRDYLIEAMLRWLGEAGFDGLRFDDADITPLDFLDEIRRRLHARFPQAVLLAQSCDELQHLAACDLTHDGGARAMLCRIADGVATADDFRRDWEAATYSFPRGARRLRWLEEKEQGRAYRYFGAALHRAAATVHLSLDGVPHIMMGQEFNEPAWRDWQSLFDDFRCEPGGGDGATLRHYQALLRLRAAHIALRQGSVEFIALPGARQLAYWRRSGRESMMVLVNLDGAPCALPSELDAAQAVYADGLLDDGRLDAYGSIVARCN